MSTLFKGSTDSLSAPRTSRIIEPFFRWLIPGITPDHLALIHVGVRKGGHLIAYAIFASLLWMALSTIRRLTLEARVKYTLLFSILYAATDEFHQSFYPSRGAALGDVLIDSIGAIIGLSLILAIRKYRINHRLLQDRAAGAVTGGQAVMASQPDSQAKAKSITP